MNSYVNFLSHLPLSLNGKAITYLYQIRKKITEALTKSELSIETFGHQKEGVIVYQKKI